VEPGGVHVKAAHLGELAGIARTPAGTQQVQQRGPGGRRERRVKPSGPSTIEPGHGLSVIEPADFV
jgi:hypothetical protein